MQELWVVFETIIEKSKENVCIPKV